MHELSVAAEGATLSASYSPAGETVVLALHGASHGTRSHPLYRHLHEVLPPIGVGVVTFDRRGEGESTGKSSVGDLHLQVRDALAVLAMIDAPRSGLWGYSQGAWVAPLASSLSRDVAFLVLIASTGVTPATQMMYATEQQLRRAGFGRSVHEALALRRAFEAWVHQPDRADLTDLQSRLVAARSAPWWDLAFLPLALPDADGRRAWIAEMDFDPLPVFGQVTVPVLTFYGTDDAWTPVDASVAAWRDARGNAVDVVLIEGASHDLTLPDGGLSPTYEEHMTNWLRSMPSSPGVDQIT